MNSIIRFILTMLCYNQKGEGSFMGGSGGSGGSGGNSSESDGSGNPSNPSDGGGGAGGSSDGGSAGGGDGGPGGDGGGQAGEISYPADLDSSYHGDPSILKYYDKDKKEFRMGALMKGYAHAVKSIGADKITKPGKNTTEDQWQEIYRGLGLPDTVTDYGLENKVPEGLEENKAFFDKFKEVAHSAGILPKQAQTLLDFYNNAVADQVASSGRDAKAKFDEGVQSLQREFGYGAGYDQALQVADQALETFADPEVAERLKKSGVLNNPDLTRLFIKIGNSLKEDIFDDETRKKGAMSLEDIKDEIAELQKSPEYLHSSNPGNRATMKRYRELQALKVKAMGRQNSAVHS